MTGAKLPPFTNAGRETEYFGPMVKSHWLSKQIPGVASLGIWMKVAAAPVGTEPNVMRKLRVCEVVFCTTTANCRCTEPEGFALPTAETTSPLDMREV